MHVALRLCGSHLVKYHVINHHQISQDNLVDLSWTAFTIYLWFLLGGGGSCILVTYGRTTNKVTITASYSMSILLSRSMSIFFGSNKRDPCCTKQVLYSRTMPRAVLAFWRRWSKTKKPALIFALYMRIHYLIKLISNIHYINCCWKRFSSDMSCHKSPPCRPIIMHCFHN